MGKTYQKNRGAARSGEQIVPPLEAATVERALVGQPQALVLEVSGELRRLYGHYLHEAQLHALLGAVAVALLIGGFLRAGRRVLAVFQPLLLSVVLTMALLHAPHYTAAEIEAEKIYNNRWFGGGVQGYEGDFIPSISEAQRLVFKNSLLGPFMESSVRVLLISTTGPSPTAKPPVVEIK